MANTITRAALAVRTRTGAVAAALARRLDPSIAYRERGALCAQSWSDIPTNSQSRGVCSPPTVNPLRQYFDQVTEGPGIWKWLHYFELYHRHLAKFRGSDVTIVEIGVYSGGSLAMWKDYFGPNCFVHGIDIEPACKVYETSHVAIHIGDQGDRAFWRDFKQAVPKVDIVIDDGGHLPEQQTVSLEEMLPHLQPGGVYVCEDILQPDNAFSRFGHSLVDHMHVAKIVAKTRGDLSSTTTPFQRDISSIHSYPFVTVVEKRQSPIFELSAPKHGTEWQPIVFR